MYGDKLYQQSIKICTNTFYIHGFLILNTSKIYNENNVKHFHGIILYVFKIKKK